MGMGAHRRWQKLLLADQLKKQRGICPVCRHYLPEQQAVIDRHDRIGDFTPYNIRILHVDCQALVARRRAAGHAPHTAQAAE